MKWTARLLILGFIVITLISCAEQHQFTNKENLNNILNNLAKGKFYSCNLEASYSIGNKTYPDGLITTKLPYKINKNINLIHTEENMGLIYKNDKWGYGNSIFKIFNFFILICIFNYFFYFNIIITNIII